MASNLIGMASNLEAATLQSQGVSQLLFIFSFSGEWGGEDR